MVTDAQDVAATATKSKITIFFILFKLKVNKYGVHLLYRDSSMANPLYIMPYVTGYDSNGFFCLRKTIIPNN